METFTKHLLPPQGFQYKPPWYKKPQFYVPIAVVAVLIAAGTVYFSLLAADLKAEAATFDLDKLMQMESASVIVDRNDKIFGQIYVENRETVRYDQLPRDLINAVVAAEDTKFYEHNGYDLFGIARATFKNLIAGHVRQGASTVTQQLARNSFSLKERTFHRKLLEIFLARRIEHDFGKPKIMELYLNRIYFGGGLYGAEAAARGYFNKHASEMSLAECATLAGLIKSPNRLSPWTDPAGSREARNYVLGRMRDLEFIDSQKYRTAVAEDVVVGDRQNAQGQSYAVDFIRQKVIEAVGWDRAMNEGFRIHTTIDADLQKVAEESLRKSLDRAEQHPDYNHQTYAEYAANYRKAKSSGAANIPAPEYLQGAVIGINNETGDILVLVGGRDFEHNQYDRALQAKRPVGTAMLPFVYAAAFENGMFPGSIVEDSPLDNRAVMIGGTTGILGEWGPEDTNNRYEGTITAREALSKSKDGATIRIGMNAGVDRVLQLCGKAGIHSALRPYPATFLGSSEMTLSELALAYTIFPNGGWHPDSLHILQRIEEKDGTVVWEAAKERKQETTIKPEIAYEAHSCLVDALNSGTGKSAHTQFGLKKFPAAGKTGTAYDFTDALFAGYDSNFTCSVWAGFDKPQKIYRGAFGREIALPVWVDIMNAAAEHYPPQEIKEPPGLKQMEICSRSGLLATDKCYDTVKTAAGEVQRRTTYMEIATPAQAPTEPCNVHGEPRARLVRELPAESDSDLPRAQLAVDLSEVKPVIVKGSTLLANKDPYNSVRPRPQPEAPEKTMDETIETAAKPSPTPETQQIEIRKAIPVGPLDETPGDTLLKNQTPPPSDDDLSD